MTIERFEQQNFNAIQCGEWFVPYIIGNHALRKIVSSLENACRIDSDSGSGSLTILAGPEASFRLSVDVISGSVIIGYDDATIRRDHNRITGAKRGDGKTVINFDSPSGDCIIKPREGKE